MSLRAMNLNGDYVDSVGGRELNVKTFAEGCIMTAVCLVTKAYAGLTKQESGFFTFYVKDVNANVFPARLFNVNDFIKKGYIAKSFENKPVTIKFTPQIFKGSWSLLVEDIVPYSGDFDYESFRGKVSTDSSILDNKYYLVNPDGAGYNPEYKTVAFNSICGGKCGGFFKLITSVAKNLENYSNNIPGVTSKELYTVFFYTVEVLYTKYKLMEEFEILNQTDLFNALLRVESKCVGDSMHSVIMDSCRAIIGFGTPQHLIAHLIYNQIQQECYSLELIEKNNALAKGFSTTVRNGVLVNY